MNLILYVMVAQCYAVLTIATLNETRNLASIKQAPGNCTTHGHRLSNTILKNHLSRCRSWIFSPRLFSSCNNFSLKNWKVTNLHWLDFRHKPVLL